jgi:hypothetical protein
MQLQTKKSLPVEMPDAVPLAPLTDPIQMLNRMMTGVLSSQQLIALGRGASHLKAVYVMATLQSWSSSHTRCRSRRIAGGTEPPGRSGHPGRPR